MVEDVGDDQRGGYDDGVGESEDQDSCAGSQAQPAANSQASLLLSATAAVAGLLLLLLLHCGTERAWPSAAGDIVSTEVNTASGNFRILVLILKNVEEQHDERHQQSHLARLTRESGKI